jgi:uncharacterized protein
MSSPIPESPGAPGATSKDERLWGMLCHLLGLLTSFIGPLIIWMLKKDESQFVDRQGKEALNFQISLLIYYLVASALVRLACIGVFLGMGIFVFDVVVCIMAAMKASQGLDYRYPLTIRFIS